MDKAAKYEQLVALCEQYDPELRNSHETLFAIIAAESEIGTVEATLIVSAFMDRTRLRRAQNALFASFKRVMNEQHESEQNEADRRLASRVQMHTKQDAKMEKDLDF